MKYNYGRFKDSLAILHFIIKIIFIMVLLKSDKIINFEKMDKRNEKNVKKILYGFIAFNIMALIIDGTSVILNWNCDELRKGNVLFILICGLGLFISYGIIIKI
jgi:hypothetical protein